MCELVTPHVAQGGVRTAYVMVRLFRVSFKQHAYD
jgi:hypothetical protein